MFKNETGGKGIHYRYIKRCNRVAPGERKVKRMHSNWRGTRIDPGDSGHYEKRFVGRPGATCADGQFSTSVGILGGKEGGRSRRALPFTAMETDGGMLNRHPLLGMDFPAYQKIWRLAGVDQIHGKWDSEQVLGNRTTRWCARLNLACEPWARNGRWQMGNGKYSLSCRRGNGAARRRRRTGARRPSTSYIWPEAESWPTRTARQPVFVRFASGGKQPSKDTRWNRRWQNTRS